MHFFIKRERGEASVRGDMTPEIKRTRHFSAAAAVLAAFVLAGICAALVYLAEQNDFAFGGASVLTGWRYTGSEEMREFPQENTCWVRSLSEIKKEPGATYLSLETELPPSDRTRNLVLRAGYNQLEVRLDGAAAYSTMSRKSMLGAQSAGVVAVPPSEQARRLEILLRPEFLPQLRVFLTEDGRPPLTMTGALKMAFFVLALLLVAVALLLGGLRRSGALVRCGLCGLLMALGVAALSVGGLAAGSAFFWLRAGVILLMAGGFFLCYRVLRELGLLEYSWGFFMNAGVLYTAIVLTCQYEQLFLSLLRCFGVYYLLSCAALFLPVCRQFRRGRALGALLAADLFLGLCYILYWTRFLTGYGTDLSLLILFAVLPLLAAGLAVYPRQCEMPLIQERADQSLMRFRPEGLGNIDVILELFLQDKENLRHSRNVSLYAYEIFRKSGMEEAEAVRAAQAAFLHDIGKVKVPLHITAKQEVLSDEEYEQMKRHARYGGEILSAGAHPLCRLAAVVAEQHHERCDGNGYHGLAGDKIDRLAAVTCIADVFDAVTTERPYKKAWTFEEGFAYVAEHSGSFFEPKYVDSFLKCRDRLYKLYLETR